VKNITSLASCLATVCLVNIAPVSTATSILTGIIEDAGSQRIEMPRLPGDWQRQVEWLAPEGSLVSSGDLIARLDPGSLLTQEEEKRIDLEKKKLEAARHTATLALAILDAETAVLQAESEVALTKINADAPIGTVVKLDYDRYKLDFTTANRALVHARKELAARRLEQENSVKVLNMKVAKAASEWQRMVAAIKQTKVHATRDGYFIHAQNEGTGNKIFAGETLKSNDPIAEVASRDGLQFRFWIHEADSRKFPLGSRMLITPDALPQDEITAEVIWSSKQASRREEWSQGGYFELQARPMDTVPKTYMPGMSVRGELAP